MFFNRSSLLYVAGTLLALAAGPASAQIYQGYPAPMGGGFGGNYAPAPRYVRSYRPTYTPFVAAPVVSQPAMPPAPPEVYTLTDAERNRNAAWIDVRVPRAGAEVWVSGEKTRQRGTLRYFVTDALQADRAYRFPIKVRWTEDGETQERTRIVAIHPRDHVTVDFTKPAEVVRFYVP